MGCISEFSGGRIVLHFMKNLTDSGRIFYGLTMLGIGPSHRYLPGFPLATGYSIEFYPELVTF